MVEVRTVIVDGWPDAILNAQIVDGWEFISATVGGHTRTGEYLPEANVLWFKRERRTPAERETEPD